jgi:hypothetical protein
MAENKNFEYGDAQIPGDRPHGDYILYSGS